MLRGKEASIPAEDWNHYANMPFDQLRNLIRDSLVELSKTPTNSKEFPQTKEDFLILCELLELKAEEAKDPQTEYPERPVYDGPPNPGRFTPSEELEELYDQKERALDRVEEASGNGPRDPYFRYVKQELDTLQAKITPIKQQEQREHDQLLKAYREARDPYERRLRLWRSEVEEIEKNRKKAANLDEAVRRSYRRTEEAFRGKRGVGASPTGRVQWDPLASGGTPALSAGGHYERLQREGKIKPSEFDQTRLDTVTSMPGLVDWLPGMYGLEFYSIFTFEGTDKMLLECPVYGNALYVISANVDNWRQMNKQELIASTEAKRIFHTEGWEERTMRALGIER